MYLPGDDLEETSGAALLDREEDDTDEARLPEEEPDAGSR